MATLVSASALAAVYHRAGLSMRPLLAMFATLVALSAAAPSAAQDDPPSDPGTETSEAEDESSTEENTDAQGEPEADEGAPDAASEQLAVPEPPSDGTARRRVAVVLIATGELEQSVADSLTEVVIGALAARGGVTLTGTPELQAQLGQEDEGTLECISSTTCIGRVGVELRLSEIIAGTLARRESGWVFHLDRIDVRSTRTLGRVYREVEGDLGAAADSLTAALPELFTPPVEPSTLVVRSTDGAQVSLDGVVIGTVAGGELRSEGIPPGSHEIRVERPEAPPWIRVVRFRAGEQTHLAARLVAPTRTEESPHALVWAGGGIAIAAAVGAIVFGVLSQDRWEPTAEERRDGNVTRAQLASFYDARAAEAIAANVLIGLAGVAAIGAVVAIFFPERREVEVGLGVGSLSLRGRF